MSSVKAKLTPYDVSKQPAAPREGAAVEVHFNPQTLRVSYGTTGGISSQTASAQAGMQGATGQPTSYQSNLSVELLFDTTRENGKNVRDYTLKIAAMLTKQGQNQATLVLFQWGAFMFYGSIQSMTETLDFFSEDGTPLRATVSLTMNEESPKKSDPRSGGTAGASGGASAGATAGFSAGFSASAGASAGIGAGLSAGVSLSAGAAVGTTPLTLAQSGDTLQDLTARAGVGASWKAIASANDIDNPRLLDAGAVLNLNARASVQAK